MNKDKIPAAMYIRMSTEHQKYSPENQAAAIREYAERNDYEIIKTYTDGGKSGLNIAGRAALQQMLKDVQSRQAEYKAILVLDVTRWGRFQDADESAYYEYICKRAGTPVKYCNEQFDNDGSPVATIVKGVKRTMAAEYSRELSCKVFAGKCRLINLGYRQGGFAGFGLRRMLVNEHWEHKGILAAGEHKSIATDIRLKLSEIVPSKDINKDVFASRKYAQIVSSIREIGLIEAPIVTFSDNPDILEHLESIVDIDNLNPEE